MSLTARSNALVESFHGLYKWELIYPQGPWAGLEDVEWATLSYVDWFNDRRLRGEITDGPGYTTPAAFEAAYYRQTTPAPRLEPNKPSLHETRGVSVGALVEGGLFAEFDANAFDDVEAEGLAGGCPDRCGTSVTVSLLFRLLPDRTGVL